MTMLRIFGIVGLVIATSFYIFPFEFKVLPGINTKMAMAGLGLIILFFRLAKERGSLLNKNIFNLSIIAIIVSLIGFASITYNNTLDTAYATYIVSVWVWLAGAYTTIVAMRKLHGGVSIVLVGNYLIAVCVLQCILAIMIDRIPIVFNLVNTYIGNFGVGGSAEGFAESGRLYGIGAAVDFAGTRFVPVLLIIAFFIVNLDNTIFRKYISVYIVSFFIIIFIGNMMSRTTTLGALMALVYWFYQFQICDGKFSRSMIRLWKYLLLLLITIIPIVIMLYNTNDFIHEKVRFGFEGFFSLFEKGYWETNSNNILKNMYRFPESFRTWMIGDGYFDNPTGDPYYVGYMWKGFYMGTDVGYLRFVFYFGLLGLLAISIFMIKSGLICMNKFSQFKLLIFMLITANFIMWFKVATDVFPILALFLIVNCNENDAYMERIALKEKSE